MVLRTSCLWLAALLVFSNFADQTIAVRDSNLKSHIRLRSRSARQNETLDTTDAAAVTGEQLNTSNVVLSSNGTVSLGSEAASVPGGPEKARYVRLAAPISDGFLPSFQLTRHSGEGFVPEIFPFAGWSDTGTNSSAAVLEVDPSPTPKVSKHLAFSDASWWKGISELTDHHKAGPLVANMGTILLSLGGGTGLRPPIQRTTSRWARRMAAEQERQARYQNEAVMILLVVVYMAFISSSLSVLYDQLRNRSQVTFYADPREEMISIQDHRLDTFLETFNQPPKTHHLQVSGFKPVPSTGTLSSDEEVTEFNGAFYVLAFAFSLDLTTWISRGRGEGSPQQRELPAYRQGVTADDVRKLDRFLRYDTNSLASVELQKEVYWPQWEELATNIKLRIRQKGFNGIVTVTRPDCEPLNVHKNVHWANFMHNRVTKALVALTFVGWIVYLFYMWVRCTKLVVRARHSVQIDISSYWALIERELGAQGFAMEDSGDPPSSGRAPGRTPPPGRELAVGVNGSP